MLHGTQGPHSYSHPFGEYGRTIGFPNDRWVWNELALKELPTYKIYELYQALIAFNKTV